MAKLKLEAKELRRIGFTGDALISSVLQVFSRHYKHMSHDNATALLRDLHARPEKYRQDPLLATLAGILQPAPQTLPEAAVSLPGNGIPFRVFGAEHVEPAALRQMETAARLPIAAAAALMPDAHSGYGLPVGGVLATRNAVIPYAVGVDIGCRMCLSFFALQEKDLDRRLPFFRKALLDNTLFGRGAAFEQAAGHEVLDRPEFGLMPWLKKLKGKAAHQLGSSGSGNHFAEFGIIDIPAPDPLLPLPPGQYLGLLTHSGSRGIGAAIARHYTEIAGNKRNLPREVRHLSWLTLDEAEGQEYWMAMTLAGDYAAACHEVIHDRIARTIGEKALFRIANHHNFAWKENQQGEEWIVHRKGATPAGADVPGIIPGSMTQPGFIVRGKGSPASLRSAAHGAGRLLSRSEAVERITRSSMKQLLHQHRVDLTGGGIDEAPQAYKDIHAVMAAQEELVTVIGSFRPRVVRMDD